MALNRCRIGFRIVHNEKVSRKFTMKLHTYVGHDVILLFVKEFVMLAWFVSAFGLQTIEAKYLFDSRLEMA